MYNILIGGAAGQGIETTVAILEKCLKRAGCHVFTVRDFMSRVRGGHNFSLLRFGPATITGHSGRLDGIVAMNAETIELHRSELIPGGFINPDLLRQSAMARDFVRQFDTARKPIATLCHGPWLLASAGLTPGRRMTSWPGVRDDVVNAGAIWLDESVVHDGNWLTSRGPQDMVPFVRALVPFFAGQPQLPPSPESDAVGSSPQRDAPPALVLGVMKWLPRPSFRALALAAALAVLYSGRKRRARSRRRERAAAAWSRAGPLRGG